MSPRDQFERTVCACPECSRHCTTCPGMLIPGDLERMAEHLGIVPYGYLGAALLASPGALVAKDGHLFRIQTIVPAMRAGKCVFLERGRCKVHPVAPFGCAYFDSHMGAAEADRRSATALASIMVNRAYRSFWQQLWDAGQRSLPPEQKRRDVCPAGK